MTLPIGEFLVFLPAALTPPPATDLPAVHEHRKAKRDARAQRGADTRRLNEAGRRPRTSAPWKSTAGCSW